MSQAVAVAIATPPRQSPVIAVQLDLTNDAERWLHDEIQRTHMGQQPLFTAHAMARIGQRLYEVVTWRHAIGPGICSVLIWDLRRRDVKWNHHATLTAARKAFDDLTAA